MVRASCYYRSTGDEGSFGSPVSTGSRLNGKATSAEHLRKCGPAPTCNGAPNKKDNDGPHCRTNEACSFASVIPAKG